MRTLWLAVTAALLLSGCASQPNFNAGGQSDGRLVRGTAGVGIPF